MCKMCGFGEFEDDGPDPGEYMDPPEDEEQDETDDRAAADLRPTNRELMEWRERR